MKLYKVLLDDAGNIARLDPKEGLEPTLENLRGCSFKSLMTAVALAEGKAVVPKGKDKANAITRLRKALGWEDGKRKLPVKKPKDVPKQKIKTPYPTEYPVFNEKTFELTFTRSVEHLKKLKDTSVIARNGREIIEHWWQAVESGKCSRLLRGAELVKLLATSPVAKRGRVPAVRIFQDYTARFVRQGLVRRVRV